MLPRYSYKIGLEQVKVDQPLAAFVRDLAAAGVPLPADIRACLAQLTPGQSVLTPAYSVRRTDGVPPAQEHERWASRPPEGDRMTQDEILDLARRMTAAIEGINTTLASLNTKSQRVDLTLIALDATMEAIRELLERHEETFARLARLLDERLPPPDNGR